MYYRSIVLAAVNDVWSAIGLFQQTEGDVMKHKKSHRNTEEWDDRKHKKSHLRESPGNIAPLQSPKKHITSGLDINGKFKQGHSIGKDHWYKPGQSGNPSGRPSKSILDQALEFELQRLTKVKKDNKGNWKKIVVARQIAKQVIKQLMGGKRGMAQLVFERIGGKPLQQIEGKFETTNYSDPAARRERIRQLQKELYGKTKK